jgi:hypothetical protein
LLQDSFSSEHTVRNGGDNYRTVRQVKSYLCAKGAEQHTHSLAAIDDYTSGDVIWISEGRLDASWNSYKASHLKSQPLVALEATKDLWAAFIRTMGTPSAQREKKAQDEAKNLVDNWLSYDEQQMKAWYDDQKFRDDTYVWADGESGKGRTQQACMVGLGIPGPYGVGVIDNQAQRVRDLAAIQRKCLYNALPWAGYQDLNDPSMHIPFAWRWRRWGWFDTPPGNYTIPDLPPDSGRRVRIKSVSNDQYMRTEGGRSVGEAWVYARAASTAPLNFIVVGPNDYCILRVAEAPHLFLSYRASDGAVKLWEPTNAYDYTPTYWRIKEEKPGIWSIYQPDWSDYMYLYDRYQSPYVDRNGNPANSNAQWKIEWLN